MILDITKISIGDLLRVSGTDIMVEVRGIDLTDPMRPLLVRASKDFAIDVMTDPLEVVTFNQCLARMGWLFRSFGDVADNANISPEELARTLGKRRLVTLHDLEIIEPVEPAHTQDPQDPQDLPFPDIDEMRKLTESSRIALRINEEEAKDISKLIRKMAERGYDYCLVGFDIDNPIASLLMDQGYTVNGRTISW